MNKIKIKLFGSMFLAISLVGCDGGSTVSNTSGGGLSASQTIPPIGQTSAHYGIYYGGESPGHYSMYVPDGNGSNYSISITPNLDAGILNAYLTNLANGGSLLISTQNGMVWSVDFNGSANSFGATSTYKSTSFANESFGVQTPFVIVESADSVPYLVNASYDGTNYLPFLSMVAESIGNGGESIPTYTTLCVDSGSHGINETQQINSIAEPNLANNPYVVFGNNAGDVCSYNVITKGWANFTEFSESYSFGSPIVAISVGVFESNYYNYFATESGQLWQATVNFQGIVTGLTQLNINNGPIPTLGAITALYADLNNNLYVGLSNGYIYGLANGSHSWQNIQLRTNSGSLETAAVDVIVPTTGAGNTTIGANSPQVILHNSHIYNLWGL